MTSEDLGSMLGGMLDDDWVTIGPHLFVDCWCGHAEAGPLDGKTLNVNMDRVHRWVTLACETDCSLQSRVHGHVHVHCPHCAAAATNGGCCTPAAPPR